MCLIAFSWQPDSNHPLVLIANRDEFHQRPTAELSPWDESPIIAGRDLESGGTWLGISKNFRWAALTNYRNPNISKPENAISRGKLVSDFLESNQPPMDYLKKIAPQQDRYEGFNLLVGDHSTVAYFSNRAHPKFQNQDYHPIPSPSILGPGIYGLSNHLLNTPWPKVNAAKEKLESWLTNPDEKSLRLLLKDHQTFPTEDLPDTGIGLEWESLLSSAFIQSPAYGTRAASQVLMTQNTLSIFEQSFDSNAKVFASNNFTVEK